MPDTADAAVKMGLLEHLFTLSASPEQVSIAYPDINTIPPDAKPGARWMRATFMPAPRLPLGVDNGSHDQISGIMQIDAMTFPGRGEPQTTRFAQLVTDTFPRGLVLVNDGQTIRISRVSLGRVQPDPPWVFLPISIYYQAFTKNPA